MMEIKYGQEELPSVEPMEQSYERDSRWKPHLSWSYLDFQQKMYEQANQRELAWQKISDKLGLLMISDGGLTFGRLDYNYDKSGLCTGLISSTNKQKSSSYSSCCTTDTISQRKQKKYLDQEAGQSAEYKRAKRRCMTVGGVIIALVLLLITILVLMAFGILHR